MNTLHKSPSLQRFLENFAKSKSFLLEQHTFSSKSLFIDFLQKQYNCPVLIITSGMCEENFYNDLESLTGEEIYEFPSWEILPGEDLLPSADVIGKRIHILHQLLTTKKPPILLAPLCAILQKVPAKELLLSSHLLWKVKDIVPFASIENTLTQLGYKREMLVEDKSQFAIRNGIIDIFPPTATSPYRIDFWGDEITDIRIFDVLSQKTIEKTQQLEITLADEKLHLTKESATLFTYLPQNTLIVFDDLLNIENQYITWKDTVKGSFPLFLSFTDVLEKTKNQQKVFFTNEDIEKLGKIQKEKRESKVFEKIQFSLCDVNITAERFFSPFLSLYDYLSTISDDLHYSLEKDLSFIAEQKVDIIFITETLSEEKALQEKIKHLDFSSTVTFQRGYLSSGIVVSDLGLCIIPYSEFIHKHKIHRKTSRITYHTPIAQFHTLQENDLVVHFHSGIGRYLGIEKIKNHKNEENEFFVIAYADTGKLYVPLSQSHLISRYIGSKEEIPTLDTLGSNKWQKTKAIAQRKILGYAADLLHLYATRSMQKGLHYPEDSEDVKLFAMDFPYTETIDQLQAISDIQQDMQSDKIMDRLICGDVGYGKTEVALRAAVKAVVDGKKQVAILVPTTVLALQHFETFKERMVNYPILLGVLSRFNPPKQNKKILQDLKEGTIDIIIGTHRLLSQDVVFKDLGLLIIDEEQRFGVKAKEHIKNKKQNVDCLTLSATPIPRTLYFSLIQARDMSVINTPPQDRLPIKTIIAENDDEIIKTALLREMLREGQSFFIHNRVESIYHRASHIQKLLPKAKIAVVHGQMTAEAIDKIFHDFKEGKADILFSTTLIENGIDIALANTILIDRADTFGLADLYQLRGRVGRWNRMAYAYFLIPPKKSLTEIARRRLQALMETGGYGSGMRVALRDLEIRGAGDILGIQQSGQVASIGFHLYCKLLKKTIDALKHKKSVSFIETKIEINIVAKIPAYYIEETSLRMEIYHRLGDANSLCEIDAIIEEVKDRFGSLTEELLWLYHITRVRLFASQNTFTFIKFEKFSFIAEKQEKKKRLEKTIFYSKIPTKAYEWEQMTTELLKNNFSCIEIH